VVGRSPPTRLTGLLGPADTLARAGGDGFVVCRLDTSDPRATEGLAARVMSALADPFTAAGTEVTLTASVGIARGRRGVGPEELVRDADTAMYAAKEAGGGRFRLIDDELRARSSERLTLESDLRGALSAGELHVQYQPVVNLVTGQISGAETLLRWTHPTRGPVSPMTFIPVAEDAGLIGPIGQYVLEQACRQAAEWNATGDRLRAEGVEAHAQMATLLTLGCRTAQGYLFAKPQSAEQVTTLLGTGLPEHLRRAAATHPDRTRT
jgi:diguanylate cyclase